MSNPGSAYGRESGPREARRYAEHPGQKCYQRLSPCYFVLQICHDLLRVYGPPGSQTASEYALRIGSEHQPICLSTEQFHFECLVQRERPGFSASTSVAFSSTVRLPRVSWGHINIEYTQRCELNT